MKWTAEHYDGFSSRLLRYTLNGVDGLAELEAKWFQPGRHRSDCAVKAAIELDDAPIRGILPLLRSMNPSYECGWDDLCQDSLTIEIDDEVINRSVRGGGILGERHPELRPFLKLFKWFEAHVLSQINH